MMTEILYEMEMKEKICTILSDYKLVNNEIYKNLGYIPDLVFQKIINGKDYKIEVEIKESINQEIVNKFNQRVIDFDLETRLNQVILLCNENESKILNFKKNTSFKFEILNLDSLQKWKNTIEKNEKNDYLLLVENFSKYLIALINKNPNDLFNLEWREVERMLATIFEKLGFKVILTPCSKDGGKDMILECTINDLKKIYVIEVKHWKQKVYDNKIIEKISKVIVHEKCTNGIIFATNDFGSSIYELVHKQYPLVKLGEKNKIITLCETYEKIENGIFMPTNIEEIEQQLLVDLA